MTSAPVSALASALPMSMRLSCPGVESRAKIDSTDSTDVTMNQPRTKRRNQRFAMSRWYHARNPSQARTTTLSLAGGGVTPLSTAVSARTMESDWSARPSTYSASSRSPSFIERITASLAKSNEFTSAVSGTHPVDAPEPAEQEEQARRRGRT